MKPIIGVFGVIDGEGTHSLTKYYINAITSSGGIPIILASVKDRGDISRLVDICDGFCFTGGFDIHPRYYGEEVSEVCGEIHELRDLFEMEAFDCVFKSGKPIIGICRGEQLVNVALGGSLYQDLPTDRPSDIDHRQTAPRSETAHTVDLVFGTPIEELISQRSISVNTIHHQAIKRLGEGLCPMALAPDGIVEAIYHESHPYLRAYQWHPEALYETEIASRKIFDDFIAAAQNAKEK
jgi:putative glutamine amidotransferase